jgi:hypothetical protein
MVAAHYKSLGSHSAHLGPVIDNGGRAPICVWASSIIIFFKKKKKKVQVKGR